MFQEHFEISQDNYVKKKVILGKQGKVATLIIVPHPCFSGKT